VPTTTSPKDAGHTRLILTLSCPDRIGIVAAVANFLLANDCNIIDSAQFGDEQNQRFFMRVYFASLGSRVLAELQAAFKPVGEKFGMQWHLYDASAKPRVLIMVSKFGHCLNDLLFRYRTGTLPIVIPAIVSNHRDFYQLAASHDIPFHHLPVDANTKARQEARLLELIESESCDLVVLARYMQILSPGLCAKLSERAINIHHSFLPSFQGARPYQQAHDRGVKLIGATAHYVTEDLDEGPIIEQDVTRVDHSMSADACAAAGRDIECLVLARAVTWHVERRILLNGHRTVIFR
jgi:formyltetrahydrofolate deformylase